MVPKYSRYAAVLPFNFMFYQERFSRKEASSEFDGFVFYIFPFLFAEKQALLFFDWTGFQK